MLLVDDVRDAWREESRQHRLALALILTIGTALRLLYVAQPMRNDEAIAYMNFVRQPWSVIVSTYADPSNHVLYTLLAKAAAGVFGPAPLVLRLPALIAGILILPATYAVVRAFYGSRAALIATALVAPSGALVLYSTNARGFSLVVLCFLLLALSATHLRRNAASRDWVVFAVLAVLALGTMPAIMFPLGTVALWLALSALTDDKGQDVRRQLLVLVVVAGLTVLVHAPILAREGGGALQGMAARNADWLAFFVELSISIGSLGLSWSLGWPPIVAVLLLFFILVALRQHAKHSRFRIGLPLAAFVFCAWLLVVTHRAPKPRVWLWLLPLMLALAAVGMIAVLETRDRTRRLVTEHLGVFAMVLMFVGTMFVTVSSAVLLTRETGAFRDAERAAEALKAALRPGDLVVTSDQTVGLMGYYIDLKGVDRAQLSPVPSRARRVFVVVDNSAGETLDQVPVPREVRDTTRFTPASVAAQLPGSRIYIYQRRNAGGP